jgi:subtilase family serine protease
MPFPNSVKRPIFAAILVPPIVIGCGGGGSSSQPASVVIGNRPPVAVSPTCSDIIRAVPAIDTRSLTSLPGVIVPETTIPKAADSGRRVHTNHLILAKSVNSRDPGPDGLSPQQVAGAYGLTPGGSGAIAVVDAFNYPSALTDFNLFATTFGLPTESSSNVTASTNATFQIVYATGSKPPDSGSWAQEASGDIEWAHAMAPNAKIFLVESASDNLSDIMVAVNVAKSLPGVREVSMSIGSAEGSSGGCNYISYDNYFLQSGVTFFAATGDTPGERDFPALSQNVVAVGGTTLNVGSTNNWLSETVWNQTGCGPSAFEPRPQFQDALYSTIGLYRAANDIVAVGDPNTGVSVYDGTPFEGQSGWFVAGGTSIAVPIIAGIVNNSGVAFASSQAFNTFLYANGGSRFFHSVTGSSGQYTAASPWGFASGLGSPSGLQTLLATYTTSSALKR